jgi:hypothetical protein
MTRLSPLSGHWGHSKYTYGVPSTLPKRDTVVKLSLSAQAVHLPQGLEMIIYASVDIKIAVLWTRAKPAPNYTT